jgi:hypothetical protein
MRKIIIIVFCLSIASLLFTQEGSSSKIRFGTEIDALPFITGGYYLSGNMSINNYRLRIVYTQVYPPSFTIPDSFKNQDMKAGTILFDYFPLSKDKPEKLWLGVGAEYWNSNVMSELTGKKSTFNQKILTAGLGWNYYLSKHIYVNPWVALHLDLQGNRSIDLSGEPYKINSVIGEGSLKIGYLF